MVQITYIKNSGTYLQDFLHIVVHLFCYIVHWDGLLLEKPETNYNLFAYKTDYCDKRVGIFTRTWKLRSS